ncbi:rhomboid family intramembrane serine protease [Acidipila sp. EB88]|uniref:rhomboid family intramembrane serine protease n=1 Tax=Acidipila sp. EB88 TaxID=2305226 RepID=UPI000F5D6D1B|nr:rhomboid family intramembrane serine protease [Acidipila sp. EB88]RRA48900.1 rhomboid family intramembrane serine protease [Acidipila sp. EB88]
MKPEGEWTVLPPEPTQGSQSADGTAAGWLDRTIESQAGSTVSPYTVSAGSSWQQDTTTELPPKPQRKRRGRQGWASAPATYLLLGINCAVFVAMLLRGVSPISPQPEQLVAWGANYSPYVLLGGEWWRLITAMFLHIGVVHLGLNMWCLWNLGLLGEPLLGAGGLIAAYLLTGFAGNLLSVAMHPGLADMGASAAIGAGASGAIFGLAGVQIVLLSSRLLPLPPADRKALRSNVILFAALNFVLGFGSGLGHFSMRIDNSAHLGGFVAGLLLALPMVPRVGSPAALFVRRRNLAVIAEALLLALLCAGVRGFYLNSMPERVGGAQAETGAGAVANFLTMASSSFLSPSLRLDE